MGSQMMLQKLVDDNNIDIEPHDLQMVKDIINSEKEYQQEKYHERGINCIIGHFTNYL